MPLPLLLLLAPAKALAIKAAAYFAHHAAVSAVHQATYAIGAHTSNQVLLQVGTHVARQTLASALAAGSVIGALKIVGTVGLGALVYYGHVEGYRKLNHLDQNGKRKTGFDEIDQCEVEGCTCADFSLNEQVTDGKNCIGCGHGWGSHKYRDESSLKAEFVRNMKGIGIDASKATFDDIAHLV